MKQDIPSLREKQEEIARRVDLHNALPPFDQLQTVGAADISCGRFSKIGYAAVVVMTYPNLELIERVWAEEELAFPYIPGFLAFREWPLVKTCLERLKALPQVLVCDGQGIAHPRRAGLASHIGVESGLITVGCAKSRLVGEYAEPGLERGGKSDLLLNGDKIGEVVRTRNHVKPLFISPGHRIDFERSTQLILHLCRQCRLPEPIREAHRFVNEIRKREYESSQR
ncbi:MAG: endonuclease V [Candidatus Omnitrophota bacterium]